MFNVSMIRVHFTFEIRTRGDSKSQNERNVKNLNKTVYDMICVWYGIFLNVCDEFPQWVCYTAADSRHGLLKFLIYLPCNNSRQTYNNNTTKLC